MFWWKFDIDKSATLESVWSAENVNDVNMWKLDSFVLFTFSFQIFTDKLRIRELLEENRISSIVSSLCKRDLKCFTRRDDSSSDACSREPHSTVSRTHFHFFRLVSEEMNAKLLQFLVDFQQIRTQNLADLLNIRFVIFDISSKSSPLFSDEIRKSFLPKNILKSQKIKNLLKFNKS